MFRCTLRRYWTACRIRRYLYMLAIVFLIWYTSLLLTGSQSNIWPSKYGAVSTRELPRLPGEEERTINKGAVLTLFTTFLDDPEKYTIYRNMILNRAALRPVIHPVLYVASGVSRNLSEILGLARENEWDILTYPRTSFTGKPFIRDMYTQTIFQYHSPLYGFASADILFEDGLIDTLQFILRQMASLKPCVITGRRTNIWIKRMQEIRTIPEVTYLASHLGSLYRVDAEDYFFMSRDYPWHKLDDVIVGRPGFDNYLVAIATINNLTVVDATMTLTALHQGQGSQESLEKVKVYDDPYNVQVIKGKVDYNMGSTQKARYETYRESTGTIHLRERPR